MSAHPAVTVAIPVYNGGRYFEPLLDSVRAQDVDGLEIIVTDNASTDETIEIARTAQRDDERVRLYRAERNAGATRNYNWGFELSRGRYFKWAAADDLLEPGFVAACVEVLENEPDVTLAYPRVVDIGPDDEFLCSWGTMAVAHSADPAERFAEVLADGKRGFPVFGVMRRHELAHTSLITSHPWADIGLLAELAIMGRFQEVPEELFCHREHQGRSTRAYLDLRERMEWFDTSRSTRWSHPYWARYGGYAKALTRARLSPGQYARCTAELVKWGKQYHRYLGHELKVTAGEVRAAATWRVGSHTEGR